MSTRTEVGGAQGRLVMVWRALVMAASVALAAACGDATTEQRTVEGCADGACPCVFTSECPGAMACVNGACSANAPVLSDATGGKDAAADAAVPDAVAADGGDAGDGGAGEVDAGPGLTPFAGFCENNGDCATGWCIDASDGAYCTRLCSDGCPEGWACKQDEGAIDPVALCVKTKSTLCQPCANDLACGDLGDRCLDIGGGRFCGRDCSLTPCPGGYTCEEVAIEGGVSSQCVPLNGTCDCTAETAGTTKGCQLTNAEGTCFGEATCDPGLGWVGCDAETPAAEVCNGVDDDCDGLTDEGMPAGPCTVESELGTCSGTQTCQGVLGWLCSAKTPAEEVCNGLDDDCDGQVDEGFTDAEGQFASVDHCGSCGASCVAKFPGAAEVACDASGAAPVCVLVACAPGFVAYGDKSCISEDAQLCQPCSSDAQCFGDGSRCVQVSETDPRTFCARDCSEAGGLSTTCPAGYACTALEDGSEQCLPESESCDCTAGNAGQTKACLATNDVGTCFGVETCDPAVGWTGCTAATPADEVCNGVDDDCDGFVDEDLPTGGPCQVDNDFGTCAGTLVCGGAAGMVCDAATPAAETCNGLDDDCDGEVDEGFAVAFGDPPVLKYGESVEHCGTCGYACPDIPNGVAGCDPSPEVPACYAAACDPGYFSFLGLACVPLPTGNQCAVCASDADCQGPGDRCVDEGAEGAFCGRDCGAGSIYGTDEAPCTGEAGVQGCCPAGNVCADVDGAKLCRPVSGTCGCIEDGKVEACVQTNAFGTCTGVRTCELDGASPGWTGCSAATPAAEVCNGVDDDCDGKVDASDDSMSVTSTPTGTAECETGPACQGTWQCVAGGWACSAKAATDEVCNGQDDDCDGQPDEDFLVGGLYVHEAHCGACGYACQALVAHAEATECAALDGVPTCLATACEEGYYPWNGGRACLPLPDNLCQPCVSDAGCLVPGSQCITAGAEKFCGRSCAPGSPFGTGCPDGYACQAVGGGQQCVPVSGSCVCAEGTVGLVRSCADGGCIGLQTCVDQGGGVYGFTACSAEGVIPEVCDGVDNDCDGQVDEGFVGPGGGYTSDESCGVCGNNCLLRFTEAVHHAVGACDAGASPPTCQIAQCTQVVEGGTTYEFVDVNDVLDDGCECKRVAGNLTVDPPDPDGVDENCDGVDGVADHALFVRSGVSASGDGSLEAPFATVNQALAAFGASGKAYILVAAGVYDENVALSEGVALYGGYAPDFATRNPETFPTELRGQQPDFGGGTPAHGTVRAVGITGAQTVVDGFVIVGYDVLATAGAGQHGHASYAVYVMDSDDSLVLRGNVIVGGAGGQGGQGSQGTAGYGATSGGGGALKGANGLDAGGCISSCTTQSANGGAGGVNSQCSGANGHQGGGVTCPVYDQPSWVPPDPSVDGGPGYSWTLDSQSSNSCGSHATEAGYPDNIKQLNGGNGKPGADGSLGLQGAGCALAQGSFASGQWVPGAAQSGAGGASGGAGGAGGSSGGIDSADAADMPDGVGAKSSKRFKLGATGGGGGAGGCGGTGGGAGGSGGASIAVFVGFSAPGVVAAAPVLDDNVIERGEGGGGGYGGYGGAGGIGGDGGVGGDADGYWIDFRAGNGGRGGRGGEGGGGGGGCGGASIGLAVVGHPAGWSLGYEADNAFALDEAVETGGPGGLPGPSGQANAASEGATGASVNQLLVPAP